MSSGNAKMPGSAQGYWSSVLEELELISAQARSGALTLDHLRKFRRHESSFETTLAEVRQSFFQDWFKKLDLRVEVFLPVHTDGTPVSDKEIRERRKKNQNLFFWPGNGRGRYNELMAAMNQVSHWTVASENAGSIAWDANAQNPFWFWAEVQPNCPRLKTPWNTLMKNFLPDKAPRLLSLEEYALVFFAYREETGKFLDISTWCWLRTCFGSADALYAYCSGSRLDVYWRADLDYPSGRGGGRLAEIL